MAENSTRLFLSGVIREMSFLAGSTRSLWPASESALPMATDTA